MCEEIRVPLKLVEVYPETLRSWYIGDLSGDEIDVQEA